MDERSYCRKGNFSRLGDDLADLVERLSRVAKDCLAAAA